MNICSHGVLGRLRLLFLLVGRFLLVAARFLVRVVHERCLRFLVFLLGFRRRGTSGLLVFGLFAVALLLGGLFFVALLRGGLLLGALGRLLVGRFLVARLIIVRS